VSLVEVEPAEGVVAPVGAETEEEKVEVVGAVGVAEAVEAVAASLEAVDGAIELIPVAS
jgi:hypothetical protein